MFSENRKTLGIISINLEAKTSSFVRNTASFQKLYPLPFY